MKNLIYLMLIIVLTGCSTGITIDESGITEVVETSTCDEEVIRQVERELGILLDCRDEEVEIDPILQTILEMSLEEKVGQLVVVGVEGVQVDEEIRHLIEDRHIGGVCLFGRNVQGEEQLKQLTQDLNQLSDKQVAPLMIAIDEEGGRVSRLAALGYQFPAAYDVGQTADVEYAYQTGVDIGEALNSYGINTNFAPVLDIHSNPNNPIIGNRAYGSDPSTVSEMALSVYQGLSDQEVIGVGKHFPGHGDTDVDSHTDLPIVTKMKEELWEQELLPFQAAIEAEIDAIMVAHIIEEGIDPFAPSSMSYSVVTDLLRKEMGYDGVVMTDDLIMGAITNQYGVGEAAVESIKAGVDMVLVCHEYDRQIEVIDAITEAVKTGELSEERLNQSVYRVLKMKGR